MQTQTENPNHESPALNLSVQWYLPGDLLRSVSGNISYGGTLTVTHLAGLLV